MIPTPATPLPTIRLHRDDFRPDRTFGTFLLGDRKICESVEPGRDHNRPSTKERAGACIPAGLYLMRWDKSDTLGWCWHVTGVPGRVGIRIHAANWSRQLRGCIAPGLTRAVIDDHNPDTVDDSGVTSSKRALALLEAALEGHTQAWLFITDDVPEAD